MPPSLSLGIRGIVFDIQRGALHDGPGLRTVVFLKGCPLRCLWCHNPESQKFLPETGKSGKTYGKSMSVEEVMTVVRADRGYYESSGGGMTLSGGEPTVQFEFCLALLKAAKSEGIETCLDTCGEFPTGRLQDLLPCVDLWHFDCKATGSDDHKQWTGVDGIRIRENLDAILQAGARVRLRCPIIPGVNDTPEHLDKLAAWESSGQFETVERLPYHTTGQSKYRDLGRPVPAIDLQSRRTRAGRGECKFLLRHSDFSRPDREFQK